MTCDWCSVFCHVRFWRVESGTRHAAVWMSQRVHVTYFQSSSQVLWKNAGLLCWLTNSLIVTDDDAVA